MELNGARLLHKDPEKKTDEQLTQEARDHLAANVPLLVTSEFIRVVRRLNLPELDATVRRALLTATERQQALVQRPDIRQRVITALVGIPAKTARKMDPDLQASLIDQVVDSEDRTAADFDEAYDPDELVVYGDAALILNRILDAFHWEEDTDPRRDALASLVESMLKERGPHGSKQLKPILMPWDVESTIPSALWNTKVPLDVRNKCRDAWIEQERAKPREPFHAKHSLEIASVRILVASLLLTETRVTVKLGVKKMDFEKDDDDILGTEPPKG